MKNMKNAKKKIARRIEELPQLQLGYVRVVHLTRASAATLRSIEQNGLSYKNQGILSATARAWMDASWVEYSSKDPRFFGRGTKAIVFDMPAEELRMHDSVVRAPGFVSSDYLVGIVDSPIEG